MKRRDFIQRSVLTTAALGGVSAAQAGSDQSKNKEYYEFRVYRMARSGQGALDKYLSGVLIPAMNKAGVKNIGVFSELGKSEPANLYVLIPYTSLSDLVSIRSFLEQDNEFRKASEEYDRLPVEQAAYARYDSSLMIAFDGWPRIVVPPAGPRLFELRTYEGYSEDAVRRKIRMFNLSEFEIFNRVKLNSVFFGENLVGKNLPSLTYMLAFSNMEERDANWKAFIQDPEWQRISKLPEYANTVSRIEKTFLLPTPYSQV